MTARILLVEDNSRLSGLLCEILRGAGYFVDTTARASEFRRAAAQGKNNMYIIDLGLPDGDGTELIEKRRSTGDKTPILVITARSGVDDHVAGLDCGADDFLVKPFDRNLLLARVRALLRRPRSEAQAEITAGKLVVDLKDEQVSRDGALVPLRPTERRLLCVLARRIGKVVARESLESALYDINTDVSANAVEQAVSRLRLALKRLDCGLEIRTMWGVGYSLMEIG